MVNKDWMTVQANDSMKICFVAEHAYPLLIEGTPQFVLGPDVHQVILARELVKHDLKVSFITYEEGGEPVEYVDGIEVIKVRGKINERRLNRILDIFRIWKAMRKAKAHIYLSRGGRTGVISLPCRLMRKKFIRQIASDGWVDNELEWLNCVGRFSNWLDIKLADAVTVQNEFQRAMLKKNFGKDGLLIRKPFPLIKRGMHPKAKPAIVLWVGAMAEVKHPEVFLKLAEAIPEGRFQMIGGCSSDNQELYNRIKGSLKRIPNLEFLGVIPFHEINQYFSRAAILVNTSRFEAFPPYAIIQAWMHYMPVVCLNTDPEEILYRYKMGFHSKTFVQLVEDVKTLLGNEQLRQEMGRNGRQYVEKEHDTTSIVRQYIDLFNHLNKMR